MELAQTIGDRLSVELLGAAPGQVVLADSTTVCFYKLAAAALAARPGRRRIVTDVDNFPTDRYVLEGLAADRDLEITWLCSDPHGGPAIEEVCDAIGDETALVTLSHVAYRSAHIADMAAISEAAHGAGALVLWDLSHSAGAVPLSLDAAGADLAVGCTYKYLNGGPGSPAFLYVRAEHQAQLRQPIWGWLGRRDPFAMAPAYEPAAGITQMLSGTPPVLGLTAAGGRDRAGRRGRHRADPREVDEADGVRARNGRRAAYRTRRGIGSPRDPEHRGAHVALTHPRARALTEALIQTGVIVDFRAPDVIRLGLSPLTTRFVDVREALARLSELLG